MFTIIYFIYSELTPSAIKNLQIDTCLQNKNQVHIVDVSNLLNLENKNKIVSVNGAKIHTHTFTSFSEIYNFLKRFDPAKTLINLQLNYEWRLWRFFRLMTKLPNYKFSIFITGQLPFYTWKKKNLLQTLMRRQIFKLIFLKLLGIFLFKIKYLKQHNVFFYAGKRPSMSQNGANDYPINYVDYDLYLNDKTPSKSGYIVFADDALFQHPDDAIVGNPYEYNTLQEYRSEILNFFKKIEAQYKLPVVIAAHPKSTYSHEFFEGHKVVKNQTHQLIKNANFILCHMSTSLDFAVLYDKEIIFLTSPTIYNFSLKYQPIHFIIQNLATILRQQLIDVTSTTNPQIKPVNQEAYEQFKLNYLTTKETRSTLTEELFQSYLEDIFKKSKS